MANKFEVIKSPLPPTPPIPDKNLSTYLFEHLTPASPNDYTLYIDGITGAKQTRNQFLARMKRTATALDASPEQGGFGLKPIDTVGLLSENCMDFPAIVHGLLYLTVPFSLYATYSTVPELVHQLRLSKPTRIFVSSTQLSKVLKAADIIGLSHDKIHILHGEPPKKYISLVSAIEKTSSVPQVAVKAATKDTLAYLVFSSGTSGLPKGVMISHGNIIEVNAQGRVMLKLEEAMTGKPPAHLKVIGFQPMYHSMGFMLFVFRPFLSPMTVIVLPKWNAERFLDLIPKYQVTSLLLIPSLVHQLLHHPAMDKPRDFSSLDALGSAAAYLPPSLAEQFKKKIMTHRKGTDGDLQFHEGYGLSEATLGVLLRAPTPPGENAPLSNAPMALYPGMEGLLLVEDGQWRQAKVGEPGELFVRGGNVALGYFESPEATKQTFGYSFNGVGGGWMRTGDRFLSDSLQRLVFQDRSKDVLKVSGTQVTPTELERTLIAHPEKLVLDACVAGVTPPKSAGYGSERVPRAWVVLTDAGKKLGTQEVTKRLDEWVKQNLSKYKWLTGGIEVVDEIPKSVTGKVIKRELQEKYEQAIAAKPRSKL